MPAISIVSIEGLAEVTAGMNIGRLIAERLRDNHICLRSNDIIVVAQKIVSKAEGRTVDLADVIVSDRAIELSQITAKDPRVVEVVLSESSEVLRARRGLLIVRHRLGFVMAQAGVDRSNVPGEDRVLLLPKDPDASAEALMRTLRDQFRLEAGPGVVVSDSFGRPWRHGTTNVALGVAGMPALWDRRGELDRGGRVLEATQVAWADAVAAAAGLAIGEGAEGIPAALVRGLTSIAPEGHGRSLIRSLAEDLFR
jgi:coenzyme F420-0:L-glutamate ligase / coenzyme F420-1:gamma-L-glutamate ligase